MTTQHHPALNKAPKNLKESLERALTFMITHKGGAARYEDDKGCPCLIGSYFTPEQRQWIIAKGYNDYQTVSLVHEIGHQNLTAMTGMNTNQCWILQTFYDSHQVVRLTGMIQEILDGKTEYIQCVHFTL